MLGAVLLAVSVGAAAGDQPVPGLKLVLRLLGPLCPLLCNPCLLCL